MYILIIHQWVLFKDNISYPLLIGFLKNYQKDIEQSGTSVSSVYWNISSA